MFLKTVVIAASFTLSISLSAQESDLKLDLTDPSSSQSASLEGDWTYSSCGKASKSARDHILNEGDVFSISLPEASRNDRIIVHNERWTMIEQPILRMDGTVAVAENGIAVVDGHRHQMTFRLIDQANCPGAAKDQRTIEIQFSDIEHSHGDDTRHAGSAHGHSDGSNGG